MSSFPKDPSDWFDTGNENVKQQRQKNDHAFNFKDAGYVRDNTKTSGIQTVPLWKALQDTSSGQTLDTDNQSDSSSEDGIEVRRDHNQSNPLMVVNNTKIDAFVRRDQALDTQTGSSKRKSGKHHQTHSKLSEDEQMAHEKYEMEVLTLSERAENAFGSHREQLRLEKLRRKELVETKHRAQNNIIHASASLNSDQSQQHTPTPNKIAKAPLKEMILPGSTSQKSQQVNEDGTIPANPFVVRQNDQEYLLHGLRKEAASRNDPHPHQYDVVDPQTLVELDTDTPVVLTRPTTTGAPIQTSRKTQRSISTAHARMENDNNNNAFNDQNGSQIWKLDQSPQNVPYTPDRESTVISNPNNNAISRLESLLREESNDRKTASATQKTTGVVHSNLKERQPVIQTDKQKSKQLQKNVENENLITTHHVVPKVRPKAQQQAQQMTQSDQPSMTKSHSRSEINHNKSSMKKSTSGKAKRESKIHKIPSVDKQPVKTKPSTPPTKESMEKMAPSEMLGFLKSATSTSTMDSSENTMLHIPRTSRARGYSISSFGSFASTDSESSFVKTTPDDAQTTNQDEEQHGQENDDDNEENDIHDHPQDHDDQVQALIEKHVAEFPVDGQGEPTENSVEPSTTTTTTTTTTTPSPSTTPVSSSTPPPKTSQSKPSSDKQSSDGIVIVKKIETASAPSALLSPESSISDDDDYLFSSKNSTDVAADAEAIINNLRSTMSPTKNPFSLQSPKTPEPQTPTVSFFDADAKKDKPRPLTTTVESASTANDHTNQDSAHPKLKKSRSKTKRKLHKSKSGSKKTKKNKKQQQQDDMHSPVLISSDAAVEDSTKSKQIQRINVNTVMASIQSKLEAAAEAEPPKKKRVNRAKLKKKQQDQAVERLSTPVRSSSGRRESLVELIGENPTPLRRKTQNAGTKLPKLQKGKRQPHLEHLPVHHRGLTLSIQPKTSNANTNAKDSPRTPKTLKSPHPPTTSKPKTSSETLHAQANLASVDLASQVALQPVTPSRNANRSPSPSPAKRAATSHGSARKSRTESRDASHDSRPKTMASSTAHEQIITMDLDDDFESNKKATPTAPFVASNRWQTPSKKRSERPKSAQSQTSKIKAKISLEDKEALEALAKKSPQDNRRDSVALGYSRSKDEEGLLSPIRKHSLNKVIDAPMLSPEKQNDINNQYSDFFAKLQSYTMGVDSESDMDSGTSDNDHDHDDDDADDDHPSGRNSNARSGSVSSDTHIMSEGLIPSMQQQSKRRMSSKDSDLASVSESKQMQTSRSEDLPSRSIVQDDNDNDNDKGENSEISKKLAKRSTSASGFHDDKYATSGKGFSLKRNPNSRANQLANKKTAKRSSTGPLESATSLETGMEKKKKKSTMRTQSNLMFSLTSSGLQKPKPKKPELHRVKENRVVVSESLSRDSSASDFSDADELASASENKFHDDWNQFNHNPSKRRKSGGSASVMGAVHAAAMINKMKKSRTKRELKQQLLEKTMEIMSKDKLLYQLQQQILELKDEVSGERSSIKVLQNELMGETIARKYQTIYAELTSNASNQMQSLMTMFSLVFKAFGKHLSEHGFENYGLVMRTYDESGEQKTFRQQNDELWCRDVKNAFGFSLSSVAVVTNLKKPFFQTKEGAFCVGSHLEDDRGGIVGVCVLYTEGGHARYAPPQDPEKLEKSGMSPTASLLIDMMTTMTQALSTSNLMIGLSRQRMNNTLTTSIRDMFVLPTNMQRLHDGLVDALMVMVNLYKLNTALIVYRLEDGRPHAFDLQRRVSNVDAFQDTTIIETASSSTSSSSYTSQQRKSEGNMPLKTPVKRLQGRAGRRQSTSISSPKVTAKKRSSLLPVSPSQRKSLLERRHSVSVSEVDNRSRTKVNMMSMFQELQQESKSQDNKSSMKHSESVNSQASEDNNNLLSVIPRGDSFAKRHKSTDFDESMFSSFDDETSSSVLNVLESTGSHQEEEVESGVVIHYVMVQDGEVVKDSLMHLDPSETGVLVSQDHFSSLVDSRHIGFLRKRFDIPTVSMNDKNVHHNQLHYGKSKRPLGVLLLQRSEVDEGKKSRGQKMTASESRDNESNFTHPHVKQWIETWKAEVCSQINNTGHRWQQLIKHFPNDITESLMRNHDIESILFPRCKTVVVMLCELRMLSFNNNNNNNENGNKNNGKRVGFNALNPVVSHRVCEIWSGAVSDVVQDQEGIMVQCDGNRVLSVFGPPFFDMTPSMMSLSAVLAAKKIKKLSKRLGRQRVSGVPPETRFQTSTTLHICPMYVGMYNSPMSQFQAQGFGKNIVELMMMEARQQEILASADIIENLRGDDADQGVGIMAQRMLFGDPRSMFVNMKMMKNLAMGMGLKGDESSSSGGKKSKQGTDTPVYISELNEEIPLIDPELSTEDLMAAANAAGLLSVGGSSTDEGLSKDLESGDSSVDKLTSTTKLTRSNSTASTRSTSSKSGSKRRKSSTVGKKRKNSTRRSRSKSTKGRESVSVFGAVIDGWKVYPVEG